MGEMAITGTVQARNKFGEYITECEAAATRTVEKAVERGAELSRQFAPIGHKPDLRTIPLAESITTVMFSARSGSWGSGARHALPQEMGATSHPITGFLGFYWEERGKSFVWDDPEYDNWTEEEGATIEHPGNDPQPFLYPAYRIITQKLPGIAAREYPG